MRWSRPQGSPSKPEWSITPAIARGCSDWSSRARMPPTNIEASPCTRRMAASSGNHRGPSVPCTRSRRRGPSGPATRAKSRSPRVRRTSRTTSAGAVRVTGPVTRPVCPRTVHAMQRWESWSGLETAQPAQVLTPASPAEVVDAVVAARTHGLTVKMVGSGHSFTGIAVAERPAAASRPAGRDPHGRPGRDDRHRAGRHAAARPQRAAARPRPGAAQHGRHRPADRRRRDRHRHPRHRRALGVAVRAGRRARGRHR